MTGLEFCDALLHSDARIIAFPMSLFYDGPDKQTNTMVRFSICKTPEYVSNAAQLLRGLSSLRRANVVH